jgi:hypothetical protein
MGAFDTFSNKADEYGQQAKDAVGNKRNKAADADNPEQAERGVQQEGQERGSELDEKARRRMGGQESDDEGQDDDNWA